MCYALNRRVYHLKVYNLFIVAMLFLLTSCSTPPPVAEITKEEISPVAGELICAAAGICLLHRTHVSFWGFSNNSNILCY